MLVCLSVWFFLSNRRKNGRTERAKILCGTSHDPRCGGGSYGCSKCKTLASNKILFSLNFENQEIFNKIHEFFVFVIQCNKEKMFTIEMEDESLVLLYYITIFWEKSWKIRNHFSTLTCFPKICYFTRILISVVS